MPGLDLGAGATVRAGSQSRYGNSPAPTTASAAAFGTANDVNASTAALTPSTGPGLAFWTGAVGVAGLLFIYYSLPGG